MPEGADAADHRAARPLGDGGVRELRAATARGTRDRLEVELNSVNEFLVFFIVLCLFQCIGFFIVGHFSKGT